MNKSALRLIGATLLAVLAFLAISFDQTLRWEIAALVGVPSFVLMIVSRRQLGNAFSIMPEAKALVTKGLYSHIQHPMYVFLDLFFLAIIVAVGWPPLLALFAVLVGVQIIQARREEKVLESAFGSEYASYMRHIWF